MTPANPVAKEIEYRNHTYKTAGNLNSVAPQISFSQISSQINFAAVLFFFFF
jgi:hypothetical protein